MLPVEEANLDIQAQRLTLLRDAPGVCHAGV